MVRQQILPFTMASVQPAPTPQQLCAVNPHLPFALNRFSDSMVVLPPKAKVQQLRILRKDLRQRSKAVRELQFMQRIYSSVGLPYYLLTMEY